MALIASAHAAIFSTDPAGIIRSWNPGSELLFGYSREEAIGMPLSVLSPPGREVEEKHILEAALGRARIERYDTRQLRKGGDVVDVSLTMSCILDQADAVAGASIVAFDNTERKANELKLTEDLTRLRRTFETSPFGMAVVDGTGHFVDVNPALCGLLQTPADQLLASTFQAVTHRAAALRSLGCQFAQGFLFARPQPPEAIGRLREGSGRDEGEMRGDRGIRVGEYRCFAQFTLP